MSFEEYKGIKIYNNILNDHTIERYKKVIEWLKLQIGDNQILGPLVHSTITVYGNMLGIVFNESKMFSMLRKPIGDLLAVTSNFGTITNGTYVLPEKKNKSKKGRKPKKKNAKRKSNRGDGNEFDSQIRFLVRNPENNNNYYIMVFRNGSFLVPGVKRIDMTDLYYPLMIVKDYLERNLLNDPDEVSVDVSNDKNNKVVELKPINKPRKTIKIVGYASVMRNYKTSLLDNNIRVNLKELIQCIKIEKKLFAYDRFINNTLFFYPENMRKRILSCIGRNNILGISEIIYIPEKCFKMSIKISYQNSLPTGLIFENDIKEYNREHGIVEETKVEQNETKIEEVEQCKVNEIEENKKEPTHNPNAYKFNHYSNKYQTRPRKPYKVQKQTKNTKNNKNTDKKTTIKLLKKGKINLDNCDSEYGAMMLYLWIQYVYLKYKDTVLMDISTIKNVVDPESEGEEYKSEYDDNDAKLHCRNPIEIIKRASQFMNKPVESKTDETNQSKTTEQKY